MLKTPQCLLIGCGALAKELQFVIKENKWDFFKVECLPAKLHNYPQFIVPEIKKKIQSAKLNNDFKKIFILYGDCGTGGQLDKLLSEEKVDRIAGNHCYEFYAGTQCFKELFSQELGTFYLTDYLARFFDKLIIEGLGIKKNPELKHTYFKNYKKLIYLAQTKNNSLEMQAKKAANYLELEYSYQFTGYANLKQFLEKYKD